MRDAANLNMTRKEKASQAAARQQERVSTIKHDI